MYQDPHQTKAQFDAEVAAYAFMDDTAAAVNPPGWEAAVSGACSHGGHGWDGEQCEDINPAAAAPKPAGDLDVFTSAELEQQSDLYYANGSRLYAAAKATDGLAGHLLMSAAMEQFELQGAVCLELARRFAETSARNA